MANAKGARDILWRATVAKRLALPETIKAFRENMDNFKEQREGSEAKATSSSDSTLQYNILRDSIFFFKSDYLDGILLGANFTSKSQRKSVKLKSDCIVP